MPRRKCSLVLAASLLLAAATASAASFDCRLAQSRAEKMICASATLGRLDQEMAALYQRNLAQYSGSARAQFVSVQRQWLRDERDRCTDLDCLGLAIWQHSGMLRTSLQRTGQKTGDIAEVASTAQHLERLVAAEKSEARATTASDAGPDGPKERNSAPSATSNAQAHARPSPRAPNTADATSERDAARLAAARRQMAEASDRRAAQVQMDQHTRLGMALASAPRTPQCMPLVEVRTRELATVRQFQAAGVSAVNLVDGIVAELQRSGCAP